MIMNNYKKFLMGIQAYFATASSGTAIDMGQVNTSGISAYMTVGFNSSYIVEATNQFRLDKNFYLALGSGSETLTEDDYVLASDISSSFTNLVYSTNFSVEDGEYKRTFTVSGLNNSGSEKTITRVAYIKNQYNTGGSIGATTPILFAVCDLAQSVTVADGDSFAITLKWNDV